MDISNLSQDEWQYLSIKHILHYLREKRIFCMIKLIIFWTLFAGRNCYGKKQKDR